MDLKSFLKYKSDQRTVLGHSIMKSDEYIKEERARNNKMRTILLYRLFGRDGVTDK